MKEQKIKVISRVPGSYQIAILEIDAFVLGDWAFHAGIDTDAHIWVVSHVPSGHALYFGPKRLCRVLVRRLHDDSKHTWNPSEKEKRAYSPFLAESRYILEETLAEFTKKEA